MAPSAKTKKAAKGKTAAANAAAAALSKPGNAANKAAADEKSKPAPSRPAPRTKVPAGSSPVTAEQVLKASRALLQFLKTQSASAAPKKPNLLGDEAGETGSHGIYSSDQVWLVVTTMKSLTDKKDLKPKAVKVPYPLLNPETTSALLLVKDPQRVFKDILLPSSPTVRKVLGLGKLRAKFKTYETLRQLRDTHDLILADERITPSLRTALGSSFLRTTAKIPIPIRVTKKNGNPASQEVLEKEVKKAVEATYIHLAQTNSTNVRIGLVKHSAEQLVENVLAVIEYMITDKKCVKAGWKGVRGVYIKSGQSTALPLYLAPKIYDKDKDVTTAEQRKEEKEVSEEKKKANEERRKAKKVKMLAAKKGISMAAGASETNGASGIKAAEPGQKKRKADPEDKNEETATEEVEGTPKSKKQKIVTVAKPKKPAAPAEEKTEAAPTTKAEAPAQKGKKSKSETATAPVPAVEEEKKEEATPNISKAKASRKAAKEVKTQEVEVVGEKVAEEKEAEKSTAKAAAKKGRVAKVGKLEEEKVDEKKAEPKRRSKRVSTGDKA